MGARIASEGKSIIEYQTREALKDSSKNGSYITQSEMDNIAKAAKESGLSSEEAEKVINDTIDTFQKSKGTELKQKVTLKKGEFAGAVNKVEFNLEVLKKERKSDVIMDQKVKSSYGLTSDEAFSRRESVIPLSEKKKKAVTRADHVNVIYDEKIEKAKSTITSRSGLKVELENIEKERAAALAALDKKPVTTRAEHVNALYDDKVNKIMSRQNPSPDRDQAIAAVENERKQALENLNKKPAVTKAEHINIIYDDKVKKAREKFDGSTPALAEELDKIERERQAALKNK
jgi:hypothetical protein